MRSASIAGATLVALLSCTESDDVTSPQPTTVDSMLSRASTRLAPIRLGPTTGPDGRFPIGVYVTCKDRNLRESAERGLREGLNSSADEGFKPRNGYDPARAHVHLEVMVESVKECDDVLAVSAHAYRIVDGLDGEESPLALVDLEIEPGSISRGTLLGFPDGLPSLSTCRTAELSDHCRSLGEAILARVTSDLRRSRRNLR